MSADKFPSIFSRQVATIVYIFSPQMEAMYLLLTEFEVRTVSYGPSVSSSIYGPSAKREGHKS